MIVSKQTTLDKSQEKSLNLILKQYLTLDNLIEEYKQRQDILKNKLIDMYELFDIDKHQNVKLIHRTNEVKMTIQEFKELFNDDVLTDYLVVDLDVEGSLDSLYYALNVSQPIVDAMKDKIKNLKGFKTKQLVIEGR